MLNKPMNTCFIVIRICCYKQYEHCIIVQVSDVADHIVFIVLMICMICRKDKDLP